MPGNIRTHTLRIADMTCAGCERKIEKALQGTPGILHAKAGFAAGVVEIRYDAGVIDPGSVEKVIEGLDYHITEEKPKRGTLKTVLRIIWISIALYELYAILDAFELLDIFYNFPEAKTGMGYGMLFMVGALTSVHCVAMCGGINLSQALPHAAAEISGSGTSRFIVIRSGFLYNLGRVISYTCIGGFVGTLGGVVSPSESVRGFIQIVAGIFMVIMGLNMMNIFPWLRKLTPRMPKIFGGRIRGGKNNGPLYVGLINGLMPCGPLQAMQLYALSTGSFTGGALSMFAFSAGTLPLMFTLSALSSILSKRFTHGVMTVGAAMVVVMGVAMFGNGTNLTGFSFDARTDGVTGAPIPINNEVVQLVRTDLKPGRYDPIKVQAGVPVRWTIHAAPGTVNGCNNKIVIPEYDRLQKKLALGDNIVEFVPTRTGTFAYTCWMGMIRGKITVVEGNAGNRTVAASELDPVSGESFQGAEENYGEDPFAVLFGSTENEGEKSSDSMKAKD